MLHGQVAGDARSQEPRPRPGGDQTPDGHDCLERCLRLFDGGLAQNCFITGYVIETREVKPPDGFAENDWVFYEITRQFRPSERYNFQGKIYVLINGGCWSATDDYADLVKRTRLGTVVGQNTSGSGGAHLAPGVIRLPRSGMIFRVETELLLRPNGEVNELFGTEPDVRLPSASPPRSITRDDLLQDAWIKEIVTIDD